jgi:outer membrane protein
MRGFTLGWAAALSPDIFGGLNEMKKFLMLAACAALTACLAGNAAAEELRGRLAVNAKLGVTNPANSEMSNPAGKLVVDSDAGIIGGGGFLYGVDDYIAVELGVTQSSYHTSGFGWANVTDVSVGAQYRFPERQRLIPYGGAGLDVLINDLGAGYANTVVGAHLAVGIDYMLMRQVALNAELKGVEAFTTDVRTFNGGNKIGEFDPSSISFTVGARFFFN